jgi:uncharacterized membrane protein
MIDASKCTALFVAGAIATALSTIETAHAKAEQEKCYGVSLKGKK